MISQDPVGHLLTYGHKNPEVSQFVQHALIPLKRDIDALTQDTCEVNQKENQQVYQDKNTYYSSLSHLQYGYDYINQYFTLMMDGNTPLYDKKEIVALFNVIYDLRAWIGWGPGVIKRYTGFQSYTYDPIEFSETEQELLTHFLTYTFLTMKAGDEGQQDQSLQQALSVSMEGFYKARAYYAKTQLQPEAVNRAKGEDINKWLHERAINEVNLLVTFMSWLIQTAHYLHDNPILVNDGE